jgi:uncharacterized protein (DUF362 family)
VHRAHGGASSRTKVCAHAREDGAHLQRFPDTVRARSSVRLTNPVANGVNSVNSEQPTSPPSSTYLRPNLAMTQPLKAAKIATLTVKAVLTNPP